MIADALKELQTNIDKAHDSLKRELVKIRTGRAHPSLLESVRVENYGTHMALSSMATINVADARMLTVKAWDKTQVKAIEKAIVQAPLGLNPQTDGDLIRIPLPPLTEERRKEFVKLAKGKGEECKVAIRHARHEAKDFIKTLVDEKEVGKDDGDRAQKEVDDRIQKANSDVDAIVSRKEADILEV
jgi:ribosome recycling factor